MNSRNNVFKPNKRRQNDLTFVVEDGGQMTPEDMDAMAKLVARMILRKLQNERRTTADIIPESGEQLHL